MLNTYTHHCNGTCGERLDQQQKTIKAKNLHISRQSVALDKASKRIVELEKKERVLNEILRVRNDAIKFTDELWIAYTVFPYEVNRILNEYESEESE